jgi:hypothetical protein
MEIAQSHIDQLARRGYAIVPDFLGADELEAARRNMLLYFPSAQELAAAPHRYPHIAEDPENLQIEFPFIGDALNDISTHRNIIQFVETVLGTDQIMLSQAAIWAKYAGTGEFEQGLHSDFQGNTLVYPREEGSYRQVNMILYYSDVPPDMGPTYVVSREHTDGLSLWPPFRTRRKNPELYKLEKPVLATAGTLFIFGMSTFHRASSITAAAGARFSHHLVYRGAQHAFAGYHQWSRHGENLDLSRFIQQATPRQREMLGFPRPGDPYWTAATLAGVAARYPKMDMAPYQAGAKG